MKYKLSITLLLFFFAGLVIMTFTRAQGFSYFSNNPAACTNCHVMNDAYSQWQMASHRSATTCNSCHVPSSTLSKYFTKARQGFWHSFYFTTGWYEQPLRASKSSRDIIQANCRNCHDSLVHNLNSKIQCTQCHANVGHKREEQYD